VYSSKVLFHSGKVDVLEFLLVLRFVVICLAKIIWFVYIANVIPSVLVSFPRVICTSLLFKVDIHVANVTESSGAVWAVELLFSRFRVHSEYVCFRFVFCFAFRTTVAAGEGGDAIGMFFGDP